MVLVSLFTAVDKLEIVVRHRLGDEPLCSLMTFSAGFHLAQSLGLGA